MLVNLEREIATASILHQIEKQTLENPGRSVQAWARMDRESLLGLPNFPRRANRNLPGMPPIYIDILDEIAVAEVKEDQLVIEALQFLRHKNTCGNLDGTNHLGSPHYGGLTGIEIVKSLTLSRPVDFDNQHAIVLDPSIPWEWHLDKTFGGSRADKNLPWTEYTNARSSRIMSSTEDLRDRRFRQYLVLSSFDEQGAIAYAPQLVTSHEHEFVETSQRAA
jgi:hypothetical protein